MHCFLLPNGAKLPRALRHRRGAAEPAPSGGRGLGAPPPGTAATPGAAAEGAPGLAGVGKTLEPGEVVALPGEGECQGSDLFIYFKYLSIYLLIRCHLSGSPPCFAVFVYISLWYISVRSAYESFLMAEAVRGR